MLVDEKEIRPFRIARLHQERPRQRDGREGKRPPDPLKLGQQSPLPRDQQIDHEDCTGQHNGDQSLRQKAERGTGPGRHHPGPGRTCRLALHTKSANHAHKGECHERREAHVGGVDVADQKVVAHGREHGCSHPRRVATRQRAHRKPQQQQPEQPGRGWPPARRKFVLAKGLERQRCGPVLQRWFLEVFEPIEPGRDIVRGQRHFARDFGISAFIGAHQGSGRGGPKPGRKEKRGEQREEGTREGHGAGC